MDIIEQTIKSFLDKKYNKTHSNVQNKLKIYYENQYSEQYKKDESIIRDIIKKKVKTNNDNDKLDLIIYYKGYKTKQLLMQNNLTKSSNMLSTSWTIYKYTCPHEDCELLNSSYIGQTRNTLRKRLQQHVNSGAIKEHLYKHHRQNITQDHVENNTKVVKQFSDISRLTIYEALLIVTENPNINRQVDNFINPLKLFSRRPSNTAQSSTTQNSQHQYNLRSTS